MDLKKYPVNEVNSWNGWDPLKQVVLGNCFPPEFFEDLADHKLRDLLQQILYETQEDLIGIKKTLEDLGVEVIQTPEDQVHPYFDGRFTSVNDFNAVGGQLTGIPRPCLCPRDDWLVLGNRLLFTSLPPGSGVIHETMYNKNNNEIFNPDITDFWNDEVEDFRFAAPNVTRVGDKLIIDLLETPWLADKVLNHYPQYEGANTAIGGHNDGSFNLPKPGLVVCGPWLGPDHFKDTLPGWEVLRIEHPNYMNSDNIGHYLKSWAKEKDITKGRWWHPEIKNNKVLVDYVDKWLNEWVGFAEESVFEVNMLSISEEVILSLNYQKEVHDKLKQHGMEAIYCRMRHRNFWDAGLHCLTLDTYREGGKQNYFTN